MNKRRANLLILLLAFWFSSGGLFARPVIGMKEQTGSRLSQAQAEKIHPSLQSQLRSAKPADLLPVIVRMARQEPALPKKARKDFLKGLKSLAEADQKALKQLLKQKSAKGQAKQSISFWIFNGMAVQAAPEVIQAMAALPEVAFIEPDVTISAAEALAQDPTPNPTPNLGRTGAPALWNLGFRGQGVVVANMDTGVYLDHPDLIKQWRGGTNSWFDPYGQHATPADVSGSYSGHGTYTMGVMVGQGSSGAAIGMAPDAQWIAVKIFNDSGKAQTSAIHRGFQWLLDPDGDPNTDDSPDVVNNSWGMRSVGCSTIFQADLQALRAVNILPVFSAGNEGSLGPTSPADLPEAFSVGALDLNNQAWISSSQGPSPCGEPSALFPKASAPGVDIWTAETTGSYAYQTGTSMAAPHVAGGLALLLSAFPGLPVDLQEKALLQTAIDVDIPGPDNITGHGSVNVMAAYEYVNQFLAYRYYFPVLDNTLPES